MNVEKLTSERDEAHKEWFKKFNKESIDNQISELNKLGYTEAVVYKFNSLSKTHEDRMFLDQRTMNIFEEWYSDFIVIIKKVNNGCFTEKSFVIDWENAVKK